MEKKFTKGEWLVTESLSGKTFIAIDSGKIGMARHQICEVFPEINEGDYKANAKLIAAAPEMFRALELIASDAPEMGADWALMKAQAAIKKATS